METLGEALAFKHHIEKQSSELLVFWIVFKEETLTRA